MQPFEKMIETIPTTLAFQDALSNSVGAGSTAATTAAPGAGPVGPTQQQPAQNPFGSFGPVLILGMVFILGFSWLTSRKEKKRREQLLAEIKKGEKVLTIGGIIGVVADIRDEEVLLRIDDNSNVKMRFTRSSIQQVLKSAPGGESAGESGGGKGGAAGQVEFKTGKDARVTT